MALYNIHKIAGGGLERAAMPSLEEAARDAASRPQTYLKTTTPKGASVPLPVVAAPPPEEPAPAPETVHIPGSSAWASLPRAAVTVIPVGLNGAYHDLPEDEYFGSPALSNSGLKLLARSPLHYDASLTAERKETPAFRKGKVFHTLVLEPERFDDRFAINDDNRNTNVYKAFAAANATKTILKSEEITEVEGMASSLRSNRLFAGLFAAGLPEGQAESSYFWRQDGIACKARLDWVNTKHNVIVDLKTTEDAAPEAFAASAYRYKYHWQAYWYLKAYKACTGNDACFIFAAVEKTYPYAHLYYQVPDSLLELAALEIAPLLELYRECKRAGEWPGYLNGDIATLFLPPWATKKLEQL